jgi:TatD DNase family protein
MPPAALIDIGIPLVHDSYDHDRAEVIAAARAAGVSRMIVTGSSLEVSRQAIALARQWPGTLWCTAGVHPHHASEFDEHDVETLEALARAPEVVAVGECGLDYFRNYSPHADQERAFRLQLGVAAGVAKPLFLHQRDAHRDLLRLLDPVLPHVPRAVVHCMTGTVEEAREYLARGLYIGITGWICDERRGRHLREVVRAVPADRLMIETDGPYLLPRDLESKPGSRRNEPKYLPHILQAIADARGEPVADLSAAIECTTREFFGLPPR